MSDGTAAHKLASTFIPGFHAPVRRFLAMRADDPNVLSTLDGMIIYESEGLPDHRRTPFFRNSFLVLAMRKMPQAMFAQYGIGDAAAYLEWCDAKGLIDWGACAAFLRPGAEYGLLVGKEGSPVERSALGAPGLAVGRAGHARDGGGERPQAKPATAPESRQGQVIKAAERGGKDGHAAMPVGAAPGRGLRQALGLRVGPAAAATSVGGDPGSGPGAGPGVAGRAFINGAHDRIKALVMGRLGFTGPKAGIAETPGCEFRLHLRREGLLLFMLRLTRPHIGGSAQDGHIRPDLAHILAMLAAEEMDRLGIHGNVTALDPFCGDGTVVYALASAFSSGRILYSDWDDVRVSSADEALRKAVVNDARLTLVGRKGGIKGLSELAGGKAHCVVTQPDYGGVVNVSAFFAETMKGLKEMLIDGGVAVVLTDRPNELLNGVGMAGGLSVGSQYSVGPGGGGGSAYVLRKG